MREVDTRSHLNRTGSLSPHGFETLKANMRAHMRLERVIEIGGREGIPDAIWNASLRRQGAIQTVLNSDRFRDQRQAQELKAIWDYKPEDTLINDRKEHDVSFAGVSLPTGARVA